MNISQSGINDLLLIREIGAGLLHEIQKVLIEQIKGIVTEYCGDKDIFHYILIYRQLGEGPNVMHMLDEAIKVIYTSNGLCIYSPNLRRWCVEPSVLIDIANPECVDICVDVVNKILEDWRFGDKLE